MANIISGIRTFFKSPLYNPGYGNIGGRDIGIVGVPYDAGCTFKRGASFGPAAIRDASVMLCDGVDAETQVDVQSRITDLNDVEYSFDINDYNKNPLKNFSDFHLITVGGDHGISKMTIQHAYEQYGKVSVIHFDAHNDAWDGPSNHGTFIREVMDAGWISNLTQIGIRSPSPLHVQDYINSNQSIKSFSSFEVNSNMNDVLNHLHRVQGYPTFITFDIDVFEPSYIGNGTGTPEPFGLTPMQIHQLLKYIFTCSNKNIIGMDLVEVSPQHDSTGLAAAMAANIIWKYIAYL